jgi:DNA-directed RNA polymerase subunit M/transcription elongation factor TFIIS
MAAARDAFKQYVRDNIACLSDEEVTDMELGVYNWAIERAHALDIPAKWSHHRFLSLYNSKARSVAANVSPDSYVGNQKLVSRLKDNEFLPHDIAHLSSTTVFPDRWRQVIEEKIRREDNIVNTKPAAMTDQFKCSRCKKRECSFIELQIRSCDEPASLFIQCIPCGHHWRVG